LRATSTSHSIGSSSRDCSIQLAITQRYQVTRRSGLNKSSGTAPDHNLTTQQPPLRSQQPPLGSQQPPLRSQLQTVHNESSSESRITLKATSASHADGQSLTNQARRDMGPPTKPQGPPTPTAAKQPISEGRAQPITVGDLGTVPMMHGCLPGPSAKRHQAADGNKSGLQYDRAW